MKAYIRPALGLAIGLLVWLSPHAAGEPGDLDMTFGGTGMVTTSFGADAYPIGKAVAVQSDGRVVVAGEVGHYDKDVFVARYNTDGSLDTRFNGTGLIVTEMAGSDHASGVVVLPDGKIVVAGLASVDWWTGYFFAARYNSSGSLDATFGSAGKVLFMPDPANLRISAPSASSMAVQPDGRIVVAGQVGGSTEMAVVRFTANGAVDATFNGIGWVLTNVNVTNSVPGGVLVQPDGKIVVIGSAYENDQEMYLLLRYNPNGTLDSSFGTSGVVKCTATPGTPYASALQPDGRIVVAGSIGTDFALARFTASGGLDSAFNGSGYVRLGSGYAVSVALQSDGRILAGGHLPTLVPGDCALVRTLVDGSLDASFHGTGAVAMNFGPFFEAMTLQPDGKIVAVGGVDNPAWLSAVARYLGPPAIGTARFSAASYLATEAGGWVTIPVQRIQAYSGSLTVAYETEDGTATASSDYVPVSGTLTFGPGEQTKMVRVQILRDAVADGGETFNVVLKTSPDLQVLDTAKVMVCDRPLALSSRKLRSGQLVTVLGRFDRTQPLYVRFTDNGINDVAIRASAVAVRSAKVRVPVLLDPVTFRPGNAVVMVLAEQAGVVAGPVANVTVTGPPATGATPGSFVLAFLKSVKETCALAEQDWQALENQAEGHLDSSELRLTLAGMQTRLQQMIDEVGFVVDGTVGGIELGTIGTEMVTLDSTGLEIMDRMLVAGVFEGKFKPATAGLARLRAVAEDGVMVAAATPDATDDFSDALNPKLQKKVSRVCALASKVEQMVVQGAGQALAATDQYLGEPGPPNAAHEQVFAATHYLMMGFRAAALGYAATAVAEPDVRLERHAPLTMAEIDAIARRGGLAAFEAAAADERSIAELDAMVSLSGRAGTFRDNVTPSELGLAHSILDEFNPDIPSSAVSVLRDWTQTIFDNRPDPTMAIVGDVEVSEPRTGVRFASFLVTLSRWNDKPVTVFLQATSGTATLGVDFKAPPASLEFARYQTFKWIHIPVLSDKVYGEGIERFRVEISHPTNAIPGSMMAHGTIRDAHRVWVFHANVAVQGYNSSTADDTFTLVHGGGVVRYTLAYGVIANVLITEDLVSVRATGFKLSDCARVTGSGEGAGFILPTGADSVIASGAITGTVHVTYTDGSKPEDLPVIGAFTAMGTE